MGKRLAKKDLLAVIEVEKNKLVGLIENLENGQMIEAGVTPSGWSVKDILSHLIEWQQMNIFWYQAGKRGETPFVPAKGISWRETSKLNHSIFLKHKNRDLMRVRRDFAASHQAMLDLIEEAQEDELIAVGHFSWCGSSWCLSDYIRANTASHYGWASKHIKKWLKEKSAFN